MTVYRKNIAQPWLRMIVDEDKIYEGRIFREDWAKMKVGDILSCYSDPHDDVRCRITEILRFSTFGEAWEQLGSELVPDGKSAADVEERYSKLFMGYEDVKEVGVVCMKLQVL